MKKVVLVTGCSSGFGRALCESFSNKNYYVIASARDLSKLEDVMADMKIEMDVSDERSIQAAVSGIHKEIGRIDILINNAGYSVRSAVEEIDMKALRDMYDVNVFGMLMVMQEVLPIMRQQKSGRIINIGSISGRMTGIVNGGYCSTKYAVEAITEAARYEVIDLGIEVCVIEPGAMDTNFFRTLALNSDEKMKDRKSPYSKVYERDLSFRSRQSKSDVKKCAAKLVNIVERKKLKVRYTIGVACIYRVFIKMPDGIKEWGIRRFN
ncbi:MAG: SDR family oxidoreductase [Lachnospiraceae bacterium]